MVGRGGKVGLEVEGERVEGGNRRGVSSCRRKGRRLNSSTGTAEKLTSYRIRQGGWIRNGDNPTEG